MKISIVITVRNEEKNMRNLLDSLVIQEGPMEIIVVDSDSTDKTQEITKEYSSKHPEVILYVHGAKRGASRNYGVERATGEAVVFTDGDCIAAKDWLAEIRLGLKKGASIVAGKTVQMGYHAFEQLERVPVIIKGADLTFPSCNLAYNRKMFLEIGGFDGKFETAEDMDLNFRAVNAGNNLAYNDRAVVYHHTRDSMYGFFKQAFWNGFGRKQLTIKHGRLWSSYSISEMLKTRAKFWYFTRLMVAMLGYLGCKLFGKMREGTV